MVNFHRAVQPPLEERDVKTDVVGEGLFPGQVFVGHYGIASVSHGRPIGIAHRNPCGAVRSEVQRGHVGRDVVVSGSSEAVTELEVVKPA